MESGPSSFLPSFPFIDILLILLPFSSSVLHLSLSLSFDWNTGMGVNGHRDTGHSGLIWEVSVVKCQLGIESKAILFMEGKCLNSIKTMT